MQYHKDGFRPGDPHLKQAVDVDHDRSNVDVLIVGCGPAGLTLAAQLCEFPEINTRIIERKPGPLQVGQADGIACRSMEMFRAFGFDHRVEKEAYHVNEVCFWRPGQDVPLERADRIQDVADDLSYMPHVILSQARVHDFYLEHMASSGARLVPDYNCELVDLTREDGDFPIRATLSRGDGSEAQETVRARYVVGCDGARSAVRRSLGYTLKGEAARQLWGVMDVLVDTDFPDIRLKCAIQSQSAGSLLIIPREGGYLVRMYIELEELAEGERAADRDVGPETLVKKAEAIFAPFRLDVRQVAWWSAYEIGQRLCDRFDDAGDEDADVPRIFIAGDACHTHSPKAGQGMNVSMADAFNLGWKLAAVLRGQMTPKLLHSYNAERQAKAAELIAFDRDMARLFSAKPRDAQEAALFQSYFQKHGRYTAGVETRYDGSAIVMDKSHQDLATGLVTGTRFHSAPVTRLADAKRMQLADVLKADGRWRLIAFGGATDQGQAGEAIAGLASFLKEDAQSPMQRMTPKDADFDSVIEFCAVIQGGHREIDLQALPAALRPQIGALGLADHEKVFAAGLGEEADIYDRRGIDRQSGVLVIVRPDQFVAGLLPIKAHSELAGFFAPLIASH